MEKYRKYLLDYSGACKWLMASPVTDFHNS